MGRKDYDGKDKEEDLIIYIDDDEEKKTIFALIIEETPSTLLFKPKDGNAVRIPWNRILKIKYRNSINNIDLYNINNNIYNNYNNSNNINKRKETEQRKGVGNDRD